MKLDINLLPRSLLIVLEVPRKECDPSKVSSIYEAEKFDDRLRIQRQLNGQNLAFGKRQLLSAMLRLC